MKPLSFIPLADAMPVHWPVLLFLLTTTAFLHFVAMNVMFGTAFIAFSSLLNKGKEVKEMVKSVAEALPYSTALTVNFGVAPLLFLQALYGQFFYTSTILMGVYWLSIVGLLIVSYYSIYIYKLNYSSNDGGLFFIALPVILLILVSFFFSNNISLMQMPESWNHYFEGRNGWYLNFPDSALIPRYLHFMVSAVAVGGLAIALFFEFKRRKDGIDSKWIEYGCSWFTKATILNFGIGFWFMGTLPKNVFGGNAPHSGLFIFFVIASVATILPAMVAAYNKQVYKAASWALVTIFAMTIAREIARVSYLKPFQTLSELPVEPQYSPFIIFLLIAVGVGIILWRMFTQVRLDMEVTK